MMARIFRCFPTLAVWAPAAMVCWFSAYYIGGAVAGITYIAAFDLPDYYDDSESQRAGGLAGGIAAALLTRATWRRMRLLRDRYSNAGPAPAAEPARTPAAADKARVTSRVIVDGICVAGTAASLAVLILCTATYSWIITRDFDVHAHEGRITLVRKVNEDPSYRPAKDAGCKLRNSMRHISVMVWNGLRPPLTDYDYIHRRAGEVYLRRAKRYTELPIAAITLAMLTVTVIRLSRLA